MDYLNDLRTMLLSGWTYAGSTYPYGILGWINSVHGFLFATTTGATDRLNALENTVASHTISIGSLQTTVGDHTTSIGSLQTTVSGHTTSIGSLQTTVGGHTTDIGTLQSTVSSHGSSISTLQSTVSTHTTEIADLDDDLNHRAYQFYASSNNFMMYSCNSSHDFIHNHTMIPAPRTGFWYTASEQYASYSMFCILCPGSYTIRMTYVRNTDRPIIKLYLNGQYTNTYFDMYGSFDEDAICEMSLTITHFGTHKIEFWCDTKNASSSAYYFETDSMRIF